MKRFEGKTILVTGGTCEIGMATARRLISEGARVIITGRNEATLAESVRGLGAQASSLRADFRDIPSLDGVFQKIQSEHGKIHGAFLNAGISNFCPFDQVTEELYDLIMDTNVKGTYFALQKAALLMEDGGAIVLNSSMSGSSGFAMSSVYGASKAAVRSLARTFSAELTVRQIRVNVVSPGPIETESWNRCGVPKAQVPLVKEDLTQSNPMSRFGTADEVASAVAFLMSSDASYTTGAELVVDGGVTQL